MFPSVLGSDNWGQGKKDRKHGGRAMLWMVFLFHLPWIWIWKCSLRWLQICTRHKSVLASDRQQLLETSVSHRPTQVTEVLGEGTKQRRGKMTITYNHKWKEGQNLHSKKSLSNWAWGHRPGSHLLGRLRQENQKFKPSLDNWVRIYLKTKNTT